MEKATKQDIVSQIYENSDIKKEVARKCTDLVLEAIKKILADGNTLEIRGFGTFEVKQWENRIMKNPKTGEAVETESHKSVVFHPGKDLKKF